MARTRGFAVRLTILLGVVLGTLAGGSSASADGPPVLFIGFIAADSEGLLPIRVRALGSGGAGCGTAEVEESGDGVGFYALRVTTSTDKIGCPSLGQPVTFSLLYGAVDDGLVAFTSGDVQVREGGHVVHLFPSVTAVTVQAWEGAIPPSGGVALLTWAGPENTPVDQAAQTLGIEVVGVWHLPPGTQRFVSYIPGAPAFAQTYRTVHTGQIVVVRAR